MPNTQRDKWGDFFAQFWGKSISLRVTSAQGDKKTQTADVTLLTESWLSTSSAKKTMGLKDLRVVSELQYWF